MMNKKSVQILMPLVLLLLLALFYFVLYRSPVNRLGTRLPQSLPVVQVKMMSGKNQLLSDMFVGHWSVLHVFASWCGHCRQDQIWANSVARQHQVPVVGMAFLDNRVGIKHFLLDTGNPFSQIINDDHGRLAMLLGVHGVPVSFLVDPKGVVKQVKLGLMSRDLWVNNWLKKIKGDE